LCCVCCKDGNMERKVTWRTEGFKQYKNGSKGKNTPYRQKNIRPGAWMFVCCECCVSSGRGLCDELITRLEESYRLWCVSQCDQKKLQTSTLKRETGVGRRGRLKKKKLFQSNKCTKLSFNFNFNIFLIFYTTTIFSSKFNDSILIKNSEER
jgi:hypothetical protein